MSEAKAKIMEKKTSFNFIFSHVNADIETAATWQNAHAAGPS